MRGDAAPAFVFVPELPDVGGAGTLDPDESHHVLRVCRAGVGDTLHATDGRGALARLRLTGAGRRAAFEVQSIDREPAGRMTCIACGAPEGSRADWMIEKLAELGVGRFQPLDTDRGAWRWSATRRERLERLALAGLKQSMQRFRIEILDPQPLESWLAGLPGDGARWLADREGEPPPAPQPAAGSWIGASGPAGGFTAEERRRLIEAGFVPVRLAAGVLRAETAALALAARHAL